MKRLLIVPLLLAVALGLSAQDVIGRITYLEGSPEIVRDGEVLFDTVDFGFAIENFDSVTTDTEGYVDIDIDSSTGIDATISVQPDTLFYLDLSSLRGEQTGSIELIAGSVNVVARRLIGDSRFEIRTPAAIMGVRGTTFSVTTAVGGEMLIATDEGSVEVTQAGNTLLAEPGEAVEINVESGIFQSIPFRQSQFDEFREQWLRDKVSAFVENAPRVLRFYGVRYLLAREAFVRSYEVLMTHRDIIDKWIDQDRRGGIGSRVEALRDKRQIVGALLRIRVSLYFFEHLFTRLERMAPYVREFAADVEIREGFTAADMYRTINNDRRVMFQRINDVRRLMKLFALRNDGEMPFQDVGGLRGVFGSDGEAASESTPEDARTLLDRLFGDEGLLSDVDPFAEETPSEE